MHLVTSVHLLHVVVSVMGMAAPRVSESAHYDSRSGGYRTSSQTGRHVCECVHSGYVHKQFVQAMRVCNATPCRALGHLQQAEQAFARAVHNVPIGSSKPKKGGAHADTARAPPVALPFLAFKLHLDAKDATAAAEQLRRLPACDGYAPALMEVCLVCCNVFLVRPRHSRLPPPKLMLEYKERDMVQPRSHLVHHEIMAVGIFIIHNTYA
jgi:hypothetical protein